MADTLAAADDGANYRQLGDAWQSTRQAARKRWPYAHAAPDVRDRVRLTYGDGSGVEEIWAQATLRAGSCLC
jgi:hypothetical protein